MKVVVAPDKFKGCLSASDVAAAIARGIAAVDSAIEVVQIPMAGHVQSLNVSVATGIALFEAVRQRARK